MSISKLARSTKHKELRTKIKNQRPKTKDHMSLLVVGSVAFDEVETPFGKCERMLGGSASHFSVSASYFTDVRLVAVVGGDFGDDDAIVFATHSIDTIDLEKIPNGKTFRWFGRYDYDLN